MECRSMAGSAEQPGCLLVGLDFATAHTPQLPFPQGCYAMLMTLYFFAMNITDMPQRLTATRTATGQRRQAKTSSH